MSLAEIYNAVFTLFRKGRYYREGGRRLFGRKRKRLGEAKAHTATLDFMLYEWCELRGLGHNKYYKMLYIPRWLNPKHKATLKTTEMQNIIDFVSPETKKTRAS